MRVVIQRVARASVTLPPSSHVSGQIGPGLLVFCGLQAGDTAEQLDWMARKILQLRIFPNNQGKMNLSIREVPGAQILLVPNFTVGCEISQGRRPSFDQAMPPAQASLAFDAFVERCVDQGVEVYTGVFGADMHVECCNDGPVTFVLETPRRLQEPGP